MGAGEKKRNLAAVSALPISLSLAGSPSLPLSFKAKSVQLWVSNGTGIGMGQQLVGTQERASPGRIL